MKVQSRESEFAFCYEYNDLHVKKKAGKHFYCNQTFDVISVSIANVDVLKPLVLCEVAVYSMGKESKFFYT